MRPVRRGPFPRNQGERNDVRYPDLQCCQKERAPPVAAAGVGQKNDELHQGDAVGGDEEECLARR